MVDLIYAFLDPAGRVHQLIKAERRLFLGGLPRRFLKEQPLGAFGGVVLLALDLVSITRIVSGGNHDPNQMTLADRLQGPSGPSIFPGHRPARAGLSEPSPPTERASRCSSRLAATTLHVVVASADRRQRGVYRRQTGAMQNPVQKSH